MSEFTHKSLTNFKPVIKETDMTKTKFEESISEDLFEESE